MMRDRNEHHRGAKGAPYGRRRLPHGAWLLAGMLFPLSGSGNPYSEPAEKNVAEQQMLPSRVAAIEQRLERLAAALESDKPSRGEPCRTDDPLVSALREQAQAAQRSLLACDVMLQEQLGANKSTRVAPAAAQAPRDAAPVPSARKPSRAKSVRKKAPVVERRTVEASSKPCHSTCEPGSWKQFVAGLKRAFTVREEPIDKYDFLNPP